MTATQDRPADEVEKEIGRDRRRKEDQRLITGRTRWTDNIILPGMLHLAMVRSPFAHATITSIDVSDVEVHTDQVARRVTLKGRVRSAAVRDKVIDLTREAAPGYTIDNELRIR